MRKNKINILFFEPDMTFGGREKVLLELLCGLDKVRFRSVLCCLYELGEFGEQLKAEGYTVYHNLIRFKYDPRSILKVTSIMRNERIDVLYMSHSLINVFIGRLAALCARVPHCVVAVHSWETLKAFRTPLQRIMLWLTERLILPHIDKFVALAASHKTHLIKAKNIPAQKIKVICNGVDLQRFDEPIDINVVRQQLQIPKGAQVVGIVARLSPEKGLDIFLHAASFVLKECPFTYFVVIGEGSERNRLEKLSRDLRISEYMRFTGYADEVPRLLKALDLSVLSSLNEAFPMTLLESMAVARPVVATNVGSVSDIVVDGTTGYLVPPGAPQHLAQAIIDLLKNFELALKFGQEGRRRVKNKFTIEKMIQGNQSLLCELAHSS